MRRVLVALTATLCLAACGSGGHSAGASHPARAAMGSVHPPGWGHPPKNGTFSLPRVDTTTRTLEQFDTITLKTVPQGARYLAGYTAGFWPTYLPLTRLPWHPRVLSIAIGWGYRAQCLDVEPGDAVPAQVVPWVRADIAAGFKRPCVYSSYWEFVSQIRPLLAAGGIARSSVWEWDADFYGTRPRLDAGFDCTQWNDHAYGLNLDESSCSFAFLGYTPPKPKPARLVCLGPHAVRSPKCEPILVQYNRLTTAARASKGAHDHAVRMLPVWLQRERYFTAKAQALLKANS